VICNRKSRGLLHKHASHPHPRPQKHPQAPTKRHPTLPTNRPKKHPRRQKHSRPPNRHPTLPTALKSTPGLHRSTVASTTGNQHTPTNFTRTRAIPHWATPMPTTKGEPLPKPPFEGTFSLRAHPNPRPPPWAEITASDFVFRNTQAKRADHGKNNWGVRVRRLYL
jgi:hypothetical protein